MSKWVSNDITQLIRLYDEDRSLGAISSIMGRSVSGIEKKVKHLQLKGVIRIRGKGFDGINFVFDKLQPHDYEDFFKLSGDFVVIADAHCPFQSLDVINKALLMAKQFRVKKCILAGDTLNMEAFGKFPLGDKGLRAMEAEWTGAEAFIVKLFTWFNELYFIRGNHEARILKTMLGQIHLDRVVRMMKLPDGAHSKIKVSDYDYCVVNNSWIIGHPSNFSQRGGQTPADIADSHQKNVITGHNHGYGLQCNLSGDFVGVDCGCSCDPKKVDYYKKVLNRARRWQQGFAIIKNNYCYPFNLRHTDWKFWETIKVC